MEGVWAAGSRPQGRSEWTLLYYYSMVSQRHKRWAANGGGDKRETELLQLGRGCDLALKGVAEVAAPSAQRWHIC